MSEHTFSNDENLTPTRLLAERLKDPNVTTADLLEQAGFEGLNEEQRLQLVEHATFKDFTDAINIIHRKVAPNAPSYPADRAITVQNPRTGEISATMAQPEERKDILENAFLYTKMIAEKYRTEGGSIKDALRRCGNVAAFGVVLAHTYEDGNGRTARTLGMLLQDGYNKESAESVEDLQYLSAGRATEGMRILSYVPSGEWANGGANAHTADFLAEVASLEIPLDDTSYGDATRQSFTAPLHYVVSSNASDAK